MKRVSRVLAALALFGAITCATAAMTISNYDSWNGSVADGWLKSAQSFTVGQNNVLDSWAFNLGSGGLSYTFSVVSLSNGMPNEASPLFSTTRQWEFGKNTVDGIGLSLTSGQQYAVVIDFNGHAGNSVGFSYTPNSDQYLGGHAFWLTTQEFFPAYGTGNWLGLDGGKLAYDGGLGTELKFEAHFVPGIPEPETVLLMSVGLGILFFRARAKNRPTVAVG